MSRTTLLVPALFAALSLATLACAQAQLQPSADLESRLLALVSNFEGTGEDIAQADLPPESVKIIESIALDSERPMNQRLGLLEVLAHVPGQEASDLLARIALVNTFDSAQRCVAAHGLALHDGAAALPSLALLLAQGAEEHRIALAGIPYCSSPEAFRLLDAELDQAKTPDALFSIYRARQVWLSIARERGDLPGHDLTLEVDVQTGDTGTEVSFFGNASSESAGAVLRVSLLPFGGLTVKGDTEVEFAAIQSAEPSARFLLDRNKGSGFAVLRVESLGSDGTPQVIQETVLLR